MDLIWEQLHSSKMSLASNREKILVSMIVELGESIFLSDIHYEKYGFEGEEVWFYEDKPFLKFGPVKSEIYYEGENMKMKYTQESWKYV